jgi:hypothetical protein
MKRFTKGILKTEGGNEMNKKTVVIGVSALLLSAAALFPMTAAAYQGNPAATGPNCTTERHDAMEKAFAAKDYNAWKSLMQGRGRMSQVITADNFAKFAEAHALAEAGKTTEAAAIRAELGLGNGNGSCGGACGAGTQNGAGYGRGMMNR